MRAGGEAGGSAAAQHQKVQLLEADYGIKLQLNCYKISFACF